LDVKDTIESTREGLRENSLYTKENMRIGAMVAGGDTKDPNAGVEDYEYKTAGFMALKEYAIRRTDERAWWDFAFGVTNFDFDFGSKEKIYTLEGGAGYSRPLDKNNRIQWHVQGTASVNRHETTRKIELGGVAYHNQGDYYSAVGEVQNKLRYEITSASGLIKGGLFATFDLGYGKIKDFKEKGDGIELAFKEADFKIVRPGAGADITGSKYTKNGKFSLSGKLTYTHDLGKLYDGPNQMKIAETSADYYALELPDKGRNEVKISAQAKYETKTGVSVGLDVTRTEGSMDSTRYGMNFAVRM
ncbi:MAG: autotransporter outer membrane beta-barrel domain-containing protein, partial [Fusobacteriaceae bacterium]|nr:autotransporter outer membrane beta-barrel domain-containing protein [Fusobacteriaceae bacterium]